MTDSTLAVKHLKVAAVFQVDKAADKQVRVRVWAHTSKSWMECVWTLCSASLFALPGHYEGRSGLLTMRVFLPLPFCLSASLHPHSAVSWRWMALRARSSGQPRKLSNHPFRVRLLEGSRGATVWSLTALWWLVVTLLKRRGVCWAIALWVGRTENVKCKWL